MGLFHLDAGRDHGPIDELSIGVPELLLEVPRDLVLRRPGQQQADDRQLRMLEVMPDPVDRLLQAAEAGDTGGPAG